MIRLRHNRDLLPFPTRRSSDLGGGMTAWTRRPSGLYVPAEERRPTAVDLFCGCGGFSLGILEAGFDVLAGVDNDCAAAQTYMVNLGRSEERRGGQASRYRTTAHRRHRVDQQR